MAYLFNVSAGMKVGSSYGSIVKFYRELAMGLLTFALVGTTAHATGDVPGYRALVHDESARNLTPTMLGDLHSSDRALAVRAALSVGRTKDVRGASFLRERIAHAPDVSVRAMALFALGLLAEKLDVSRDVRAGLGDPSDAVRAAATDAAARIAALNLNPHALPKLLSARVSLVAPLEHLARTDSDSNVRGRAVTALGGYGKDPVALKIATFLVSDLARERVPDVRMHIAWALGRAYGKVTPLAALRAGMLDPNELVRIGMVRAAGRSADRTIVADVRARLADPAWRVQEEATDSLHILAGGKRTEHLRRLQAALNVPTPGPQETAPGRARAHDLGGPRAPRAADARLDIPLRPNTAAAFGAPMPGLHPRVRIGTTKGAIVVRLYPEWAPLTVANFLGLVDRGYFDNLRWFRIVPDFVVQTGDITDSGDGDAGYMIPAEENPLEQRTGIISMGLNYDANGPQRDSAGTQFYITISPALHLNRDFTVFGEIESGMDALGRLIESDRMTRVERIGDD